MIRQYIGARYTPKFMGEYDPTTAYENLCVVDNGAGTTYISKKLVPPNIPLTNTEYWQIYGASSGAILDLQNRMATAEQDVVNIKLDINALQGSILDVRSDISDLDKRVTMLDTKKIVMLTDSYGNRTNGSGQTVGDILINKGVNIVYYKAISGGGFTQASPAEPTAYLNDYTGNHADVTDVFYCMSANDNHDGLATILTAMGSAYTATKAAYPNANVHVVPWGVCLADTAWAGFLQETTIKAYHQSTQFGYIVANNAQYMLRHTGLLDNDLIHPNTAGVDYIAQQLFGYINGNEINVYHSVVSTLTPNASISNYLGNAITMIRHNGDVTMRMASASGLLGQFEHDNISAGILAINPAFTIAASVFSIPQSLSSNYLSIQGRERNAGASTFIPSNVKFILYGGFNIRVIIENLTDGTTDRMQSITNTVCFND